MNLVHNPKCFQKAGFCIFARHGDDVGRSSHNQNSLSLYSILTTIFQVNLSYAVFIGAKDNAGGVTTGLLEQ